MTANILPGGLTASVAPVSLTSNINVYNITASVVSGIQGPPGASAQDGTFTAGENISALRVVRSGPSGVVYADSSDLADADMAIGISTISAVQGASVTVKSGGLMTDVSWNWTLDKPIYFTSTGALTQTAPTTGFSQQVATPATATTINVNINQSIKLT